MLIKEFAERAGLTPHTIRFYEKRGLLRPVRGQTNRYRQYGEEDLELVQQIKIGQALGFTLAEIRRGAEASRQGKLTAELQIGMMAAKIGEVDARIAHLRRIRHYLKRKMAWMQAGGQGKRPQLSV